MKATLALLIVVTLFMCTHAFPADDAVAGAAKDAQAGVAAGEKDVKGEADKAKTGAEDAGKKAAAAGDPLSGAAKEAQAGVAGSETGIKGAADKVKSGAEDLEKKGEEGAKKEEGLFSSIFSEFEKVASAFGGK